jgi:hypothetical protein
MVQIDQKQSISLAETPVIVAKKPGRYGSAMKADTFLTLFLAETIVAVSRTCSILTMKMLTVRRCLLQY